MNRIPVLLCGIGGYAAVYLNEFLDSSDESFTLAGVADPFASSSPRFAELEKRGVPVFKNPLEFYDSGRTAALAAIASPIHTHYSYILTCFKHGSSVLCEKPVSGDLARLDDLIVKEEETGLFAAVGFQHSFSRNTQALKADIMKGLFGKPLEFKGIFLPRRGDKYYHRNAWAGKLSFEGETILDSPLCNACSHDLHNMLFLLGGTMNSAAKVDSLEAELYQARPGIENYDAASIRAKTSGGVKLLFYTAHCVEKELFSLAEYRFEKAVIRWERMSSSSYTAAFYDGREKIYNYTDPAKEKQKIYDCLENAKTGTKPVCSLKTSRSHLECVVKAQGFPIIKAGREKLGQGSHEGDAFYYLPGLREAFLRSYEEAVLPSEAGFKV